MQISIVQRQCFFRCVISIAYALLKTRSRTNSIHKNKQKYKYKQRQSAQILQKRGLISYALKERAVTASRKTPTVPPDEAKFV